MSKYLKETETFVKKSREFKEKYRDVKKLGQGSYGVVYKVTSHYCDYDVETKALKIICGRDTESKLQEIMNNIKICKEKVCDNVVRFFDFHTYTHCDETYSGGDDFKLRFLCLQLELCSGGDLETSCWRKHYSDDSFRKKVVIGLLNGLQHMHKLKIYHGDLHEGNILFKSEKDSTVLISDFGICSTKEYGQKGDVESIIDLVTQYLFEIPSGQRDKIIQMEEILREKTTPEMVEVLIALKVNKKSIEDSIARLKDGQNLNDNPAIVRSVKPNPTSNIEGKTDENAEEIKTLHGKTDENAEEIKTLHDKMDKLTESPIPLNVREQYDNDIQEWRKEDKLYYENHSFPSMMEKVRNQPFLTFVGVSGSGKSATAHHIALKLQEEGYEVVPTKDVGKMEEYGDPKNPQVFVIDDVVGKIGLQETKLDFLTDYAKNITQPCMIKSRTLMTCRETVFNETLPYKAFLTKENTVIKLHSSDHALNDKDKKQILRQYGIDVNLIPPALLRSTSRMFPLLCKLFSEKPKFQAFGYKFFLNPFPCIIDQLNDMQRRNKLNYATLVLCMLNESSLSKDILKDRKNEQFLNMKIDTLENCELESQTDVFKFVKALSALEGTYTKQSGAQYTFIHDSMFEICAYHYGNQFPEQMLLYMNSSYIANYVKPRKSEQGACISIERGERSNDSHGKEESDDEHNEREESFDLCIRLHEKLYPLLAKRLYKDIQNMELYDVFRNRVLKHPRVCKAFIDVLEKKSYTDLKSLFLSWKGQVNKIRSKREESKEEQTENKERREFLGQAVLVDRRDYFDDNGPKYWFTFNVKVISWVIYYGHYQIMEYILQKTGEHKEDSELFEITGHSRYQSRCAKELWIDSIFQVAWGEEISRHKSESGNNTFDIKQESEIYSLVEQYRLLLLGCYSGDVQTVRVLFPVCQKAINGIDQISKVIYWARNSPLTAACEEGHVDIVKELVKEKADVNLWNRLGNTPLTVACEGGHVSVVIELVKEKADVNLQDNDGNTPLVVACQRGHVSVVAELVKAEADVNLQNRQRNTPLVAACSGGHVSVVAELVKAKADVNLQDNDGNTPLVVACQRGHLSVVNELVKAGADVNLEDGATTEPRIAFNGYGGASRVETVVKAGNTPLKVAVREGSLSTVKCLVENGAKRFTQVDDINISAVFRALILNKPDIVKYLTQKQNEISPGKLDGNKHLFNCLVAIRDAGVKTDSRDDVVVKTNSRDDVVVRDRSVWCMDLQGDLWETIMYGDCDALRHLLFVGLNVNQSIRVYENIGILRPSRLFYDASPLLHTLIDDKWFCVCFRAEKVRIVLEAGADVNVRVRYREYGSVLDREGVSVLERMRRQLLKYSERENRVKEYEKKYKEVIREIKKHVRRHSV